MGVRFPPQQSNCKTLRSESGRTPRFRSEGGCINTERFPSSQRQHALNTAKQIHTAGGRSRNRRISTCGLRNPWHGRLELCLKELEGRQLQTTKFQSFQAWPFGTYLAGRYVSEGRGGPMGSLLERAAPGPRRQHHRST